MHSLRNKTLSLSAPFDSVLSFRPYPCGLRAHKLADERLIRVLIAGVQQAAYFRRDWQGEMRLTFRRESQDALMPVIVFWT